MRYAGVRMRRYDRDMSADWRADRAEEVRELILRADPEIVEERKRRKPSNPEGVPTFFRDGLICTLETYRAKIKLTFAPGASLPDPSSMFNASLTVGTRCAIDLGAHDTLDAPAFVALVREAVARNHG